MLVLFPSENISVTPIFCYEDSINVVVMPDGHDGTAIPYETVKIMNLFYLQKKIYAIWKKQRNIFLSISYMGVIENAIKRNILKNKIYFTG